jgi:hypothetical protein
VRSHHHHCRHAVAGFSTFCLFSYTNNAKDTPLVCVNETKKCVPLFFSEPYGTRNGMRLEDVRDIISPSFRCFLSFANCIKYSESLENIIPIFISVFRNLFVQCHLQDHHHNIEEDPEIDSRMLKNSTIIRNNSKRTVTLWTRIKDRSMRSPPITPSI